MPRAQMMHPKSLLPSTLQSQASHIATTSQNVVLQMYLQWKANFQVFKRKFLHNLTESALKETFTQKTVRIKRFTTAKEWPTKKGSILNLRKIIILNLKYLICIFVYEIWWSSINSTKLVLQKLEHANKEPILFVGCY